jgi:hypothetical protein
MKYGVFEYLGDYPIDHQPLWSKRFESIHGAVEAALELYKRRMADDWELEIEAKPVFALNTLDEYHITVQQSNCCDEDAFDDPPVWGIGCIPELDPGKERR